MGTSSARMSRLSQSCGNRRSCGKKYHRINNWLLAAAVVLVMILPAVFTPPLAGQTTSTIYIRDDATGGDCALIGQWDQAARKCTITHDVIIGSFGIRIMNNGVTLDGDNFSLIGADPATSSYGVYLYSLSGVTVKNLVIRNCGAGLIVSQSDNSRFENNRILNNRTNGITDSTGSTYMEPYPSNILYIKNTISGNGGHGIETNTSGDPVIHDNVIANNGGNGIKAEDLGWFYGYNGGSIRVLGNTITGNMAAGIRCKNGGVREIIGNSFSSNTGGAIDYDACAGQVRHNDFENQRVNLGGHFGSYGEGYLSCGTEITENNFITPNVSIFASCGNQPNKFLRNYWSTFTSPDADGNGIVDLPYNVTPTTNRDAQPLTVRSGWNYLKPGLNLSSPLPFWASYSDYQLRLVSVEWRISNAGTGDANDLRITGSINSSGVNIATPLPELLGNVPAGGSAVATLKYSVPAGVSFWSSRTEAEARNAAGVVFIYP